MQKSDYFLYRGKKSSQISFPLGGIGSGSIGLAGNGRLIDWEIYNRPNKGSVNGFSHFAIRAEEARTDGKVLGARILHGDLQAPYQGEFTGIKWNTFGWGPRREHLTGLPHFLSMDFRGEFPLADLTFHDDTFPGVVSQRAFNPFIPTNDKDSSIPAAFFEFSITNPTETPLIYTVVGVLGNPQPANNLHTVSAEAWGHALHLTSDGVAPNVPRYGDLTLATDAGLADDITVSHQQYWFRGAWFDNLEVYWHDLMTPGPFKNRTYPPAEAGSGNQGLLAVHVPVQPGKTRKVRFVIAWNFPNSDNYWKAPPPNRPDIPWLWRNYYATVWADSMASAAYSLREWNRLAHDTQLFHDTLFASDLPPVALDAISANISILKSPTVLRLQDGTFYGFEGCHPDEGCCEGSCTHVWNYAQALPFLFPKLERTMREADYEHNLRDDGGMPFRLQLPIGVGLSDFRPCADGQFGGVMKSYRDWKICGDSEWLRALWPAIKASLEFAWSPTNIDQWDAEKTGVLWGRQHHTLDMELFGPNSWLTGMYLGALKAAAEMARTVGDEDAAAEYETIFGRGKAWTDENLFNGEYYIQRIDLNDRAMIEAYSNATRLLNSPPLEAAHSSGGVNDDAVISGGSALNAYWTAEHGEIKYQIAEGSSIDQVLAQWHASLYGLGDIFDPAQVRQANAAIYKYNYIARMGDVYNPCRIYALNDEGGLVICAWPEGAQKPVIPAPYSQEAWPGCEYAAASHMIMNGMVDEGLKCVALVRQRYDGERRNPWNEFECGSNYARSMASYALLNAYSGFEFDMTQAMIGFNPLRAKDGFFRCFWSLDSGWGEFVLTPDTAEIFVHYGTLEVQKVRLPILAGRTSGGVNIEGDEVAFSQNGGEVMLESAALLKPGRRLCIEL